MNSCIAAFGVWRFILYWGFWQTPPRSHMGYKPEVSEQRLGGSFLLSRAPDSQAHHRERLDELACWGGRQQRQRNPRELSEGRQRRTQRKNRGDRVTASEQGPPICWLNDSALRLKRVSVRCQYCPFHLDWCPRADDGHLDTGRPNPLPQSTVLGSFPTPTPPPLHNQLLGGELSLVTGKPLQVGDKLANGDSKRNITHQENTFQCKYPK